MPARSIILILILFISFSCTYVSTPEDVTRNFWNAIEKGDVEKAKKYAVPGSMDNESLTQNSTIELIAVSDKADVENDTARVATEIRMTTQDETGTYSFETVLVKTNDVWKVDYDKTVNSLMMSSIKEFGRELKQMGREMGKAIGEAMKEMGKAMEEALNDARDSLKKGDENKEGKEP